MSCVGALSRPGSQVAPLRELVTKTSEARSPIGGRDEVAAVDLGLLVKYTMNLKMVCVGQRGQDCDCGAGNRLPWGMADSGGSDVPSRSSITVDSFKYHMILWLNAQ